MKLNSAEASCHFYTAEKHLKKNRYIKVKNQFLVFHVSGESYSPFSKLGFKFLSRIYHHQNTHQLQK